MNFLKAYKEKIVEAPSYDDDYIYYLYEMFVRKYIPMVIEEAINNQKSQVEIPIRSVEEFFKNIIETNIDRAIRNGKCASNNRNKFNYYIPEASKYLYSLPFSIKDGYIIGDLMVFIQFYYNELQRDIRLLPKSKEDIKQSNYTFEVFKSEVVNKLIPELIRSCKENNSDKITVSYSIEKGIVRFGSLELDGLNLYDFGRYVNRIPHRDLTKYAKPKQEHLKNQYKFEYTLEDLENFISEDIVLIEKEKLRQRKIELQELKRERNTQVDVEEQPAITR